MNDQRRETRAPLAVEVTLESDNNFYSGITGNVSTGGVFIATYTPPPMGAEVELELKLEAHEPLKLRGVVCWTRVTNHAADDHAPPGCGVRWLNLTSTAEQLIKGFVDKRDTIFFDEE